MLDWNAKEFGIYPVVTGVPLKSFKQGINKEYTEELYKKDPHDPDNQEGVITHTHLELDILECEVRWALGSITMKKASGDYGIPVELFQILKDEL